MAENVFRQQWVQASYNGIPLQGLAQGASIQVRPVGGVVSLTEGTDGASVNIGTDQGIEITITLVEVSPSHEMLFEQHRAQSRGAKGPTMSIYTGTGRVLVAPECYVGLPGTLSTGDTRQGSHTYTFVAAGYRFYA